MTRKVESRSGNFGSSHFDADPGLDPTFYFNADLDPDLACHFDVDPVPDLLFTLIWIRIQALASK